MIHCVKSVRIWSFFGQYLSAFGLNTERYGVSLRIQSECGKILTRKTPNTDTFHAVMYMHIRICEAVSQNKKKCFFCQTDEKEKFYGHWRCSVVFIVNFEHILHHVLVFPLLTSNMQLTPGMQSYLKKFVLVITLLHSKLKRSMWSKSMGSKCHG